MRFRYPIIVQPQAFAESVLRDLESAIGVPSQGRRKKETDRQRETRLLQRVP